MFLVVKERIIPVARSWTHTSVQCLTTGLLAGVARTSSPDTLIGHVHAGCQQAARQCPCFVSRRESCRERWEVQCMHLVLPGVLTVSDIFWRLSAVQHVCVSVSSTQAAQLKRRWLSQPKCCFTELVKLFRRDSIGYHKAAGPHEALIRCLAAGRLVNSMCSALAKSK
jgi:hypothetical protein